MEPLVELPISKWPALQEKLKRLWPLNVAGYYALYLNLNYPGVREAFQFKVYCPYGDMDNGFVSINVKNDSQDCILFSTTQDTSKLQEALVNTKLIDWRKKVCVDLVSSLILKALENIRPRVMFSCYDVGLVMTYFLDRKTKPFDDVEYPPGTYLAPVKQHHIERIDSVWPYRYSGSKFYFSTLSSNGLSYGLFSKSDELMAWLFLNEYNFLLHLYCEEGYRRKGYAEYVMKYVVNEQLKAGNDVYAYVVEGNDKPRRLFEKLGFVDVDKGAYIYVQK
ncbi:uncharacterized protein LOC126374209 [Pectinophora gossypiella]|uniref:uncharacterized protein LOC126374209 n=1 Tax=Pectinophora gossypiella TaxID=13191 RepID=UPI00214E56B0|nr:uncharacterized protein LOC126374209 [Pectinophora gossypiella]